MDVAVWQEKKKTPTTTAGVATMMQCHVEMQLIVREKFFVDAPRASQEEDGVGYENENEAEDGEKKKTTPGFQLT